MSKTIKASFLIILQKVKIVMLKSKIHRMERSSYLNLYERIELRDAYTSLQQMEQQQHMHNGALLAH